MSFFTIIRSGKAVIIDIIIRARVFKIMCWRGYIEAVITSEQCCIKFYMKRKQRRRGRKTIIIVQSGTSVLLQTLVKVLIQNGNCIMLMSDACNK